MHYGKIFKSQMFFFCYSYLIENEVCYLVMCDKMFSKRLAFNFLEDISQEFNNNYGRKVNSVTRPYAFIEFDIYIQKSKKSLTDRRRNITTINTQLQDVQRIMVRFVFLNHLLMVCNCALISGSKY
jgi:vesicle transport protein SEC22